MQLSLGDPGKSRAEKSELIYKYILVCFSVRGKSLIERALNPRDFLPSMPYPSLGTYRVRNLARDRWAGCLNVAPVLQSGASGAAQAQHVALPLKCHISRALSFTTQHSRYKECWQVSTGASMGLSDFVVMDPKLDLRRAWCRKPRLRRGAYTFNSECCA